MLYQKLNNTITKLLCVTALGKSRNGDQKHEVESNTFQGQGRCKTECYGLKTLSSPRQVKELTPFKSELISLVNNIKFSKVSNHFQELTSRRLERMKPLNKTMEFPDKTATTLWLNKR